ncbi:MAG: hypothetical protein KGL44_01240 [Sphingomonadales bacterium]|nr:hypothetical protein [Sphingomonadales bacterium]
MSNQLPDGYAVLEPFVDYWAVSGTANRDQRRSDSTPAQRNAFYAIAKDLVPQALAQLDAKPIAELDDKERRLLDLLLSFTHVTHAVEMLTDGEARHAKFRKEMRITRQPAE